MTHITVVGAGVIGSVYGALLSYAGHRVTMLARGWRFDEVRGHGLVVDLDGAPKVSLPYVIETLAEGPAEVLIVAVRGDQLAEVLDEVGKSRAPLVLVFTNPLAHRAEVEARIGRDRLVWCFAGVGGEMMAGGHVIAHRVRQQATVVEAGQPGSATAQTLLLDVDPRLRAEPDMAAWLDTHSVFVAGMAAVLLLENPQTGRERLRSATRLVHAMTDAFDALERRGTPITPPNLRAIFGQVPWRLAALYWAAQFGRRVVTVSMLPHARATRATEQPAVARYALSLVGEQAPRYRELVGPIA